MVRGAVTAGPVRVRGFAAHAEAELADEERGNPLAPRLIGPLLDAVTAAEQDQACRALLISAPGPYFCRGLDLADIPSGWLAAPDDMPVWRLFDRLRTARVVTMALVDGQAVGGGVALAAACDLVIAGETASFRLTEALLGLVPAMALPFVADRIGEQAAFRMALTARKVGPAEAASTGLADLACPRAADGARQLLAELRRLTPDTVRALKRMRGQLFPRPPGLGGAAARASMSRLADPAVTARLGQLRAAGVLR
jgi:polyketide biosynthesis enoyl-CoA hydratase PksH